ncbi:hypothetical protein C2G38_2240232 [Gigaspora rosea]|uniref:Uncharacterized protein n=1 Tax=Gigaspora rosea TaxID=44941 RepID=A0A397VZP9_9GLOM|nr:hypothetical protein C2G38_2240232 [Gigaspora rosea]
MALPEFSCFAKGVVLCAYIVKGYREEPAEGALLQYVELYEQCWDNNPTIHEGSYVKAPERFDAILKNNWHNTVDQKMLQKWDFSKKEKCLRRLYKNTTLNSLYLKENQLGSEGGKTQAEALCKNTALTYLNLENNKLGPEDKNF